MPFAKGPSKGQGIHTEPRNVWRLLAAPGGTGGSWRLQGTPNGPQLLQLVPNSLWRLPTPDSFWRPPGGPSGPCGLASSSSWQFPTAPKRLPALPDGSQRLDTQIRKLVDVAILFDLAGLFISGVHVSQGSHRGAQGPRRGDIKSCIP